jgi:hypothetical protein
MDTKRILRELHTLADDLDKQGYVFEGSRVRGFADGFCCEPDNKPQDPLLAGEYMIGARTGGTFFFSYSLPTMLRIPANTTH